MSGRCFVVAVHRTLSVDLEEAGKIDPTVGLEPVRPYVRLGCSAEVDGQTMGFGRVPAGRSGVATWS